MSKNKNKISIPIVKQNKDLCRMIFQKAENGKYDIKLEFRGNPYQVYTYRLFSLSPIIWNIDDPQNVNMSYHRGANDDNKVLIHLKDETKIGREKYKTLPITRIQAPNTNQLFPIPLFKMELPQSVVDSALIYKEKTYHHALRLDNANVIEIYMASDDFELDNYFENDYGNLLISQIVLSFEYFATYSVLSDYSKSTHFMPGSKPMERFRCMGGIQGMKLFVVMYEVPLFNRHWKDIHVTFIENELSEDILLCTKCAYSEPNLISNTYDKLFLGGASLEQLKPPVGPISKVPVMCNTTVQRLLNSNNLSIDEKKHIEELAGRARSKLYYEKKFFMENLKQQKSKYLQKGKIFLKAYEQLKLIIGQKVNESKNNNCIYMNAMEMFILSDSSVISEGLHILFARLCGLEQIDLIRVIVKSKKFKRKNKTNLYKNENGISILKSKKITADNTEFSHSWLVLDDMLSIDLLRGNLNMFLGDKEAKEQDVFIFRTRPYFKDDDWDGMRKRIEKQGFMCTGPQFKHYDQQELKMLYEQQNGALERLYQELMKIIDGKVGED